MLVIAAAVVVWLLSRGSGSRTVAGRPVPAPAGEASTAASGPASNPTAPRPGEIIITLSPDKLANAKIETEAVIVDVSSSVAGGAGGAGIRAAGTVQSNAYKEVPVFPVAGGIVRQINVELGDKVRRGQPLAMIFSGELADAEAAYLKVAAEVEEHHLHHGRTTELVELGAASHEDLEQATTMYKTAQANLSSARERLVLLGLSEKQIDDLRQSREFPKPLLTVEAPASGTLISRAVNTGEVVMQGKEMFRVADLSTVWVIAQVYEKDLQSVNFNASAVVTAQAFPGKTLRGRVSYVDPKVDPQTRTIQVRIELTNPREMLKLGMFVDVNLGSATKSIGGSQPIAAVPPSALQTLGAKQVVYVATDQPGSFIQREVSVGPEANGRVLVFSGVSSGERVVTGGAFLLRAESVKLNPTQSTSDASANATRPASPSQQERRAEAMTDGVQSVSVSVSGTGFQPDMIRLKRGIPARLTFVRNIEETCATAIVIASFNIKRDLPFKEPVVVEITPTKRGEFKFTCGMGMLSGKIIVD
jgi:RND family efflux transporter MFP subunit